MSHSLSYVTWFISFDTLMVFHFFLNSLSRYLHNPYIDKGHSIFRDSFYFPFSIWNWKPSFVELRCYYSLTIRASSQRKVSSSTLQLSHTLLRVLPPAHTCAPLIESLGAELGLSVHFSVGLEKMSTTEQACHSLRERFGVPFVLLRLMRVE